MSIMDDLLHTGAKVATTAAKTAGDLVEKGKAKAAQLSLENDLSKAQRQLGAFVYACHKNETTDDDLFEEYCQKIAAIEDQLVFYKTEDIDHPVEAICPECGAEVREDAMFCMRCGTKLK